jgi:hypothetical protein
LYTFLTKYVDQRIIEFFFKKLLKFQHLLRIIHKNILHSIFLFVTEFKPLIHNFSFLWFYQILLFFFLYKNSNSVSIFKFKIKKNFYLKSNVVKELKFWSIFHWNQVLNIKSIFFRKGFSDYILVFYKIIVFSNVFFAEQKVYKNSSHNLSYGRHA